MPPPPQLGCWGVWWWLVQAGPWVCAARSYPQTAGRSAGGTPISSTVFSGTVFSSTVIISTIISYTVIGCNYQYYNICDIRTPRSHLAKRSMARCIYKCDFIIFMIDLIGSIPNIFRAWTCAWPPPTKTMSDSKGVSSFFLYLQKHSALRD